MKKFKVMLSVFMVLVIILVSVIPSLAIVAPENSVVSEITWRDKISDVVWEKMESSKDNEKIPVWLWFTDIDTSDVESIVEKQTGLNKNNLSVNTDVSTENLVSALELASVSNDESVIENVSKEMKLYLEKTKEARNIERERTDIYLKTKRMISKELYEANNKKVINDLDIQDIDIFFKSSLTPSAIVYITRDEIINIAKSASIEDIDFYDETVYDEPITVSQQKDTMQFDAVYEQFGLTGDGVNVLQYELTYVNISEAFFESIPKPGNITVVRDTEEYAPDDEEYFSSLITDNTSGNPEHANQMAKILQDFSENVTIFSVADKKFSDIEWVLLNKYIDVINASSCVSTPTDYNSDPFVKWFDSLVSEYDTPIIASAGNSVIYNEDGTIKENIVLSPACGYNSIAVGAYDTNGMSSADRMHDFKYANTCSQALPNYKPDLVVASGSTSAAAPVITSLVSMMVELTPSLSAQPEVIKAILMASCHRKVLPYRDTDTPEHIIQGLTQKQGAGAIDAYRAIKIVLESTYGEKTATNGLNQTDIFTLSEIDDVNVSIAWSRENNNIGILDTQVGTPQELELNVYNGNTLLGKSDKINTGKQMVYLQNLSPDTSYTIKVNKTTNNSESVTYGYAWSNNRYDQAEIELIGKTAVGQTLTADLTSIDGNVILDENVTYIWKSSLDGEYWQVISDSDNNTCLITNSVRNHYIKCEATLLIDTTLSIDTCVSEVTNIKIVKYGDIDGDDNVSLIDSTEVNLYVSSVKEFSPEQCYAADVDNDGQITILDATYIQQYAAKLINVFPVEEQ